MFIPKWGLDIATADRFAKTNDIKTTDNDKHQQSNTDENKRQRKIYTTYQFATFRGSPCKQAFSQCWSLLEQNY